MQSLLLWDGFFWPVLPCSKATKPSLNLLKCRPCHSFFMLWSNNEASLHIVLPLTLNSVWYCPKSPMLLFSERNPRIWMRFSAWSLFWKCILWNVCPPSTISSYTLCHNKPRPAIATYIHHLILKKETLNENFRQKEITRFIINHCLKISEHNGDKLNLP